MTLTDHINYTATSDLSAAHKRRVYRVFMVLELYRTRPEITAEFAIEMLTQHAGLAEEAARTMVEGVKVKRLRIARLAKDQVERKLTKQKWRLKRKVSGETVRVRTR